MKYSKKLFDFFLKRKMKRTKLNPLEKEILKYVHDNGPCTMEDIKKHFVGKRK